MRHALKTIPRLTLMALASWSAASHAVEFKLDDDIEVTLRGVTTLGTSIRTESPDPAVLGTLSTARVGLPAGQLGGNSGGNDLNFKKNSPVSTVIKASTDLQIKRKNIGIFLRANVWHDDELKNGNRAYGNSVNGFAQNVPLSDNGFSPTAKFSNAAFADAYVFGNFDVASSKLDVRLGRQVVNWGTAQAIGGGINAINPTDAAAATRPGAQPQESRVPEGMLFAKLGLTKAISLEGFAQYEFRPAVLPGCGTFFAPVNYAPQGCNYVSVLAAAPFSVNDPDAITSGKYPKRIADVMPGSGGQFGLSMSYLNEPLKTEFRGYAMNYHNRTPYVSTTNANIPGSGLGYGTLAGNVNRLSDPNGIKYSIGYAEDVRLFGASFDTKIDPATRIFGEMAYRPNQPINLNAADMIAAFLTRAPTSALQMDRQTNSIAPGSKFDGYDRFKVTTANLGFNKVLPNLMGAQRLTLTGEVGLSHVAGLPDPSLRRYGRSDDYGVAQHHGLACTANAKTCSLDGFVTTLASGYRIRAAATYPGALLGATVIPSLGFTHDAKGNSHDGVFVEGRKSLRPSLRFEWGQRVFAEMQYVRFSGGDYFTQLDRDHLNLFAGMRF